MNFYIKTFLFIFLLFNFYISQAQTSVFNYGIASGDATSEFVILWTHVQNLSKNDTVKVYCEVSKDSTFSNLIYKNIFFTEASRDYTVKIDAGPLQSNSKYYYRFISQNDTSKTGVTYTLANQIVDNYKIAFASCANYEAGFFNAYQALAEIPNLKALVHLGDYIYEYESGKYAINKKVNRTYFPAHELITLNDYRTRYKQYKQDKSLKILHSKIPFYCIWDDHEFADDAHSKGADNHSENIHGSWLDRSEAAKKAYFEWMPIRESSNGSIYRKLSLGNLISFYLLDTRMDDRKKGEHLMSIKQQDWYFNALKKDSSIWKLTVQQVMMSPLTFLGIPINADQWDGFKNTRNKLFEFIKSENIENFIVLSGDFHSSWANELTYKKEIIGREIVCPGITSPGINFPLLKHLIPLNNPNVKFSDLSNQGFVTLDINASFIVSKWHFLETIDYPCSNIKSTYVLYLPAKQLVFSKKQPIQKTIVEVKF
ncbi:MAG: hypothetical protein RLZZ175_1126 [Bacteroidota bacterium]|jgi:alkaline phosphatase D